MFDRQQKEKFFKALEAFRKNDMVTVKKYIAEVEIDNSEEGYATAEPTFPLIEKGWLEKGIAMGAIAVKNGQYYPLIKEYEKDIVTGYRGRVPTIEKKKTIDASVFFLFLYQYEEYRKKKYVLKSI